MTAQGPAGRSFIGAPPPRDALFYRWVLLALAGLGLTLQWAALGPLRNSFWGVHLYSFLPLPALLLGSVCVVLAALGWFLPFHALPVPHLRIRWRRRTSFTTALVLAAGVLFLVFRSEQTLLGDAQPILLGLPEPAEVHPREPLAALLLQWLYRILEPAVRRMAGSGREAAHLVVSIQSASLGVLFVAVVLRLARALTSPSPHRESVTRWAALLILSQGYSLVFFGYVEYYALSGLLVALFALAAVLFLQRRIRLTLAGVVLVVAIGAHLSSVLLVPSFGFLVVLGMRDPTRRWDAFLGVVASLAAFFLLDLGLRGLSPGFSLPASILEIFRAAARPGEGAASGYMFSVRHLRDFFNAQYLIGPLAALLFLPALARGVWWALRNRRLAPGGGTLLFLALLALPSLGGAFFMSEPRLGYPRDWDLFAATGVTFSTAGVGFLLHHVRDPLDARRLLGFGVVLSLVHLVPWVAINHSEHLSVERFRTLPLGRGRTETVLGRYYLERQELDEAERWLRKALVENPANNLAYAFLGDLHMTREEPGRACDAYAEAVRLHPDKEEFHRNYAAALLAAGNLEGAREQLLWLTDRSPEVLLYWSGLSRILGEMGRTDERSEVDERILLLHDARLDVDPDDVEGWINSAEVLSRLGREEDALVRLRTALIREPGSERALYRTAVLLARLGREPAARSILDHLVRRYPRYGEEEWIRTRLGTEGQQ